jgi:hypothetical protein
MRVRRLVISAIVILGLGLTGLQAQKMQILETGGKQSAYFLSDIEKMSFSSGNITLIKSGGDSFIYALSDILSLNYNQTTSVVEQSLPIKTNESFVLYPNPANEVLYLQLSSGQTTSGVIEIISVEGKIVYTQELNSNSAMYEIDMSNISKGLYIIKVNRGSSVGTAKFIKQ